MNRDDGPAAGEGIVQEADEVSPCEHAGLRGATLEARELELGYWLLKPYQGHGYACEAALRSKQYAEEVLDAKSLVSYIAPDNTASIRLAEALGAEHEKTIELLKHGPHRVYRYF